MSKNVCKFTYMWEDADASECTTFHILSNRLGEGLTAFSRLVKDLVPPSDKRRKVIRN